MRRLLYTLVLALISIQGIGQTSISTARPWTYWWWMGSAVSKADITKQLTWFSKSGLGGVHIIPIYGVKGFESKSIPFLSEQWLEMLQFTVSEGKRLGLGVDMSTGTGWPFGGPNVKPELSAQQLTVKGTSPVLTPTKQQVKRAAPGGEGLVLDPFSHAAMAQYLTRFDTAFAKTTLRPRAMYMDSYEAYGANWTGDFFMSFNERRGYDLGHHLSALNDSTAASALIRIDYHQTLAEVLRERYAYTWTQWSRKQGFITRYQAHGSPGNLLDLYDESDVPETESFGSSRFPIPGLRVDPDYSEKQFGTPNPLAMKFASSAAHFSGKPLVSSETGTWLANHFKVSLSQVKPQIDELFVSGINHIFYHGTTYSPATEPYPGWLFYASTNFGPQSHFAGQFPLLNSYVEACQSRLQAAKPDNDVLLYFPIHDLWATKARSAGGVHLLEVHHVDRWLLDLPFGKLAQSLWQKGYSFDFVSDRQLERLRVQPNGSVSAGAATYKTILVPAQEYMSLETMRVLAKLANSGAKIVFQKGLATVATGYHNQASRTAELQRLQKSMLRLKSVRTGDDVVSLLSVAGVQRETMADAGLRFIRKKDASGQPLYFITNPSTDFKEGWVRIIRDTPLTRFDPVSNQRKALQKNKSGEVYLRLLPGESCFLESVIAHEWQTISTAQEKALPLEGTWTLQFGEGRPALGETTTMEALKSWTEVSDSAAYFSGTGRYTLRFDASSVVQSGKDMEIDLGDVRESADVSLNGQTLGTTWCIPFRLVVPAGLLREKGNVFEVRVHNLSANYMRLRDSQQPDWKKFYDINVVDITYKKFKASDWPPMPSGLLGPVRLLYR